MEGAVVGHAARGPAGARKDGRVRWDEDRARDAPRRAQGFERRGSPRRRGRRDDGERSFSRADASRSLRDRKSTRLNSSHGYISYAVFCLKKKKNRTTRNTDSYIAINIRVCRE